MQKKSSIFSMTSYMYFFLLVVFFMYSFTQVDLNLTLFTHPLYQKIQQSLTYIGYFNRPLSTILLSLLFLGCWIFYFWILQLVKQEKLSLIQIRNLIFMTTLLIFAYPAFSHDLFNYMFDARIVTKYELDPRFFKALDFPFDPWTRFMRWTHRYYPYGPGWLLLTLVPSFFGFDKFTATLLLFKLFFGMGYMVNCFLIYKILKSIKPSAATWGTAFFAFNPLVIIESIVSPHNEVLMLTFVLFFIYLCLKNHQAPSVISLIFSISVKFLSLVLLPLLWFWKNSELDARFFKWCFYLWLVALIPLVLLREPYSWYFIPIVALAALNVDSLLIQVLAISLSFGVLLRYAPYFFFGDYGVTTSFYQTCFMWGGMILSGCLSFLLWKRKSI